MDTSTFYDILARCREVIVPHLPDPDVRLDFDSRMYAESLYNDLQVVARHLPPGAQVLDVGCGKGHISALLAEAGYNVVGIDVPQTPGEQLEIHSAQWQRPMWREFQNQWNVHYGYCDGTMIPVADNSLDAVLAYAVLEHVDSTDREPLLKDVVRVLRPGGYLFVLKCPRRWALAEHLAAAVGMPHHDLLVSERELGRWLEAAGWIVLRMERTDLLPAFPPLALQGWWNRLAPLLCGLERILKRTPWVLLAHHTRAIAQKPPGLAAGKRR